MKATTLASIYAKSSLVFLAIAAYLHKVVILLNKDSLLFYEFYDEVVQFYGI